MYERRCSGFCRIKAVEALAVEVSAAHLAFFKLEKMPISLALNLPVPNNYACTLFADRRKLYQSSDTSHAAADRCSCTDSVAACIGLRSCFPARILTVGTVGLRRVWLGRPGMAQRDFWCNPSASARVHCMQIRRRR
jgi:hypothetical protein